MKDRQSRGIILWIVTPALKVHGQSDHGRNDAARGLSTAVNRLVNDLMGILAAGGEPQAGICLGHVHVGQTHDPHVAT